MSTMAYQCGCGHTSYSAKGQPLFRMICHCTICQRFNTADQADILVYAAASVENPPVGVVDFATLRPPPNVQRGKCAKCDQPALELFRMPLFPSLAMIPTAMTQPGATVPEPVAHFFYDKRVKDVEDSLPKHEGYWPSQLAFGKYLLAAKFASK